MENKVKSIIQEAVYDALNERINTNREPLNEMARINTKESGKSIFPYNLYEVKIWSNDHEPPHFHVICEGWNISFLIDNGEILDIKSQGKKRDVYKYICKNVKDWLSSPCSILPTITNQENAFAVWMQLHS